ncbi:hypothetical protein H257_17048 [Aphanomyces astaci]|uniref:SET domain-containing protein n=1 Tax=Aphanomyces astaci TaxID=112090 RepID=W4FG21_APHAT|nr:hypothetical protein H257_17048 [Aphanomyces astaci]ETV66462.1 hypothetical protein H257_17048 [Aphanomyces astaci]|eukprot:XP_009843991.1 hypothetical protein H257_17048 [Aphanomyces astaci]
MEREQQLKKKYEQHQVRMKFEVVPPTALTEVYHHIDDCLPATNSLAPRRARSSRGVAFGTDTHNPHCRRCSKQFPCTLVQLCDNLITQTECAPGRCSANELCRNQAISKKLFPPTTIVDDSKLTHALRVDESVPAGTKIIEYVGEHIGKEEVAARKEKRHGAKDWYIVRVGTNGDLYVDASKFGNNSRFINHAYVPNCRFEVWYVDTKPRLMVVANTALEQGTILTLSYMNAALAALELVDFMASVHHGEHILTTAHLVTWLKTYQLEWLAEYMSSKPTDERTYKSLVQWCLRFGNPHGYHHRVPYLVKSTQEELAVTQETFAADFGSTFGHLPKHA